MSAQFSQTRSESNETWLPLIEYSVKAGVSLSTIRRKIKSNSIPYRLEKGRYLILFQSQPRVESKRMNPFGPSTSVETSEVNDWKDEPLFPRNGASLGTAPSDASQFEANEGPVVTEKTVQWVTEAFETALKEKEQRIRMLEARNRELEEQLGELRLLIKVLEEKYEVRY